MLAEKLGAELENKGMPGAGNTYIGNALPLAPGQPTPDLVVVMWSGLTRKDVLIDHEDKLLMKTLDGYGYVRWCGFDTSYVLSGGITNSWQYHPATKEIFYPLYKISNERSMAAETLLNIISLQNYLKNKKIPYIMSSYVNYWTDAARVCEQDFGIKQFKDLEYLVKQIDFDHWVFANDKKDCIYELAAATPNGLEDDKFHPALVTHELWTNILMEKIEKGNYLVKEN